MYSVLSGLGDRGLGSLGFAAISFVHLGVLPISKDISGDLKSLISVENLALSLSLGCCAVFVGFWTGLFIRSLVVVLSLRKSFNIREWLFIHHDNVALFINI